MARRLFFINLLGGLGYLSCLLQWVWAFILYLPSIIDSHALDALLPAKQPTPIPATPVITPPSPLLIAVAVIVTVIVLVFTIYALLKLPITIAKAGKKITREAAELTVPIISHHQKLPAKKRRLLTARLVRIMKLLLVIIPLVALLFVPHGNLPIAFDVVFFIGSAIALGSILWFSLQLFLARVVKVDFEALW